MTKGEIAVRLTDARKKAGLTQAELSKTLGTSQSAVARAESGYWMPRLEFIDRWARVTKTEIPVVFGAPDPKLESASRRRSLVREVLGSGRFNPWDRNPSKIEAERLESSGLTREYFQSLSAAGRSDRQRTRH